MAVIICYISLKAGLQNTYSSSFSYFLKKQWKIYLLMCLESSNLHDIKRWQSTI